MPNQTILTDTTPPDTTDIDDWRDDAACRGLDVGLFFGQRRVNPTVRKLCAGCPVLEQCKEWAITNGEHGFWGGMSERARIQERRNRGLRPTLWAVCPPGPPPHGTARRAQYERRHGGPICDLCLEAERRDRAARHRRTNEPLVDKKFCPDCRRVKPGTEFNLKADSPDGLQRQCVLCHRESSRRWYANTGRAKRGRA